MDHEKRILLALDILTERKNMLTLENEEYALLAGTSDKDDAIAVSAELFKVQLEYARKAMSESALALQEVAMEKIRALR